MSNAQTRPAPISIDDYLDGETRTEIKHEYLDGEVVAMGGASAKHGLVVTGLGLAIGQHARRRRVPAGTLRHPRVHDGDNERWRNAGLPVRAVQRNHDHGARAT